MRSVQTVSRQKLGLPKRRSLTVVVASEHPVSRWDGSRFRVIKEVMLMAGIVWRSHARSLPIVDSHDRSTIKNVFGSIRGLRVQSGKLLGEVSWARDKRSQDIASKWRDEILWDFSITAEPLEMMTVQAGQVWRGVSGPIDLITRWTPIDASVVVGAR